VLSWDARSPLLLAGGTQKSYNKVEKGLYSNLIIGQCL